MTTAISTKQTGGLATWMAEPNVVERLQASLGDAMPADQFIAHMLTAFQDPKIAQCSDKSKYTAIHECAAMALLPTLDQVRLIPYKNELKAMPQWQGYKALMERHPDILEVQGVLVHIRDEVSVDNGEPHHSFDPFDPKREFKSVVDIRGGYCKILYRNGRPPKYHFVTARQIAKAQACAQTNKVWTAWYEQMAMKTLYRDCFARRAVPIDPLVGAKLQRTLIADDLSLGNDPGRVQSSAPQVRQQVSVEDLLGKSQPVESEPDATGGQPGPEPGPEPDGAPVPTVNELLAKIEVGDEAEIAAAIEAAKAWSFTKSDQARIKEAADKRRASLKA